MTVGPPAVPQRRGAVRWGHAVLTVSWRLLRRRCLMVESGHRMVPLGWVRVPVGELRVRREPLLIPAPGRDCDRRTGAGCLRAENPIERFFPVENGVQDRRFRHSPHYHALAHYLATGERDYRSDYARLWTVRAEMQGVELPLDFGRRKVDALCDTFDSVRRNGYRGPGHRREPIMVLDRPLGDAFGIYVPTNWEVVDGHHRAAAALAAGLDSVDVFVMRGRPVGSFSLEETVPWDESLWKAASPEGREAGSAP